MLTSRRRRRVERRFAPLSRHIPSAEYDGGECDECGGVGEEDKRGLQGIDGRLRRGESPPGLTGERVGEEGRVLAGEELAGVLKSLVLYRQVEDDGFEDQGVYEPDPDGERRAPEERGQKHAERRPDRQYHPAGTECADKLSGRRQPGRCAF